MKAACWSASRAGMSAGGIPFEFPVHPIQETGKRPTAALDRNLTYLSLVECLYGYYMDGVVLTTTLLSMTSARSPFGSNCVAFIVPDQATASPDLWRCLTARCVIIPAFWRRQARPNAR